MRNVLTWVFAIAVGLAAGWALSQIFGPLVEPWNWVLMLATFGGLGVYQLLRHKAKT